MKLTSEEWVESFRIFEKYLGKGKVDVATGHDVMLIGPDPEEVSEEDLARLDDLGWYDSGEGCFERGF